mmetsp:Transcript_9604/g.21328  ORF Transcript_9604/g.21328 Transcript_9604/m.21328 type:complete len:116 (-) Transcript_9604:116-463(-)
MSRLFSGHPVSYVMNVTLGNVLSICGSCFLSGPVAQSKRMWAADRRGATTAYLGSIVLTFLAVFCLGGVRVVQAPLLVVLLICQYVTVAWYCLSYIPYARQTILRRMSTWTNGNN